MRFLCLIVLLSGSAFAEDDLDYSEGVYGGWFSGLASRQIVAVESRGPARGELSCRASGVCFVRVNPKKIAVPRFYLVRAIRKSMAIRIGRLPDPARGLVRATLLGDRGGLDSYVSKQFKSLGWFHLLAISGLHISALCHLVLVVLLMPVQVLYGVRAVSPGVWTRYRLAIVLSTLVVMTLYALVCGCGVAATRAWLIYLVRSVWDLMGRRRSWVGCLGTAALLNLLLLPLSFFSVGGCMSWSAYAIISMPAKPSFVIWFTKLCLLSALSFGFFGQWHLLGFVLTPFALALFPLVLLISLLLLVAESNTLVWILQASVTLLGSPALVEYGDVLDSPLLNPSNFICGCLGAFICWLIACMMGKAARIRKGCYE